MTIHEFLRDCLSILRERIESLARSPDVEAQLLSAGESRQAALRAVGTFLSGHMSQADNAVFAELRPLGTPSERTRAIVRDEIVAGRLKLGVVEAIVSDLDGLETRVLGGFAGWMTPPHSALPDDVSRYYARVIRLYIAGGTLEVFVLCRSMLEAALAVRITNERLRALCVKPRFEGKYYSASQRMKALRAENVITDDQWGAIDRIQRYGNTVVHAQPGELPDPLEAVLLTCASIGIIVNASFRNSVT